MELQAIYQVDAFTDRLFSGNPAAICPLPGARDWPDEKLLQAIALENNLSETAYFKPSQVPGADFDLRWFTPVCEVELCGHATLASAFVLFEELGFAGEEIRFSTRSGILTVRRRPRLTLDFPARGLKPCPNPPEALTQSLGAQPLETLQTDNGIYFCVFGSEARIRTLKPDFSRMASLDCSVLVTAPGDEADFVSRYFAPHKGIPEDPVTGSAHCVLTPYWAERLKKHELFAIQASARGGKLDCQLRGNRVFISGHAVLFCRGTLCLN
jgi:PhzF family phenazine biosynthesis protein